jgi:hypothetical protein
MYFSSKSARDLSLVIYPSFGGWPNFEIDWYNVHAVSPVFELELLSNVQIRGHTISSFFINYASHYPRYYSSTYFRNELNNHHLILINFGYRMKFNQ